MCIILGTAMLTSSQIVPVGELIVMKSNIIKPTRHGGYTKSPVAPVTIYKDGNVLSFGENCVGGTLQVLSGDSVVYSTVIDENCVVEIPEYISGVVELRLTIGNITFSAETEI